jgi:dolichol kinase
MGVLFSFVLFGFFQIALHKGNKVSEVYLDKASLRVLSINIQDNFIPLGAHHMTDVSHPVEIKSLILDFKLLE